jgi:filamentous hemagglutinin family protein
MPKPSTPRFALRTSSKAIAQAVAAALMLQPTLPLYAQAVVDTAAPSARKPLLDRAANGVQIVHIAPANASKVSHNLFSQFSVPTAGLVLNNSTAAPGPVNNPPVPAPAPPPPAPAPPPPPPPPNCYGVCYADLNAPAPSLTGRSAVNASATATTTTTQLAGNIGGNVLFAGSGAAQARLIVAEVTAANPSSLNGQIEVFGAGADLVVANPYGISCNGCGFLRGCKRNLRLARYAVIETKRSEAASATQQSARAPRAQTVFERRARCGAARDHARATSLIVG